MKIAAVKLQLPEVEAWVQSEIHGYRNGEPSYRQLTGEPKSLDELRNKWVVVSHQPYYELLKRARVPHGMAMLEHYLDASAPDEMFGLALPAAAAVASIGLNRVVTFLTRGQIVSILETVRDKVLDWALELERNGIVGEGMTFDMEEKKAAHKSSVIHIGTMTGSIGDHNSIGNIIGGNLNMQEVSNLAHQLQSNMPTLIDTGAHGPLLQRATSGLLAEIGKPAPDQGVVKRFLNDARNALSGATGNLLASGAIALISALLPGAAS